MIQADSPASSDPPELFDPEHGAVVQLGSGHPGEQDSAGFEAFLFAELMPHQPQMLYIPFHRLGEPPNDWTRLQTIYRHLTSGMEMLELEPFEGPRSLEQAEALLGRAEVIVLGSGLVEPYIAALNGSPLGRLLRQRHRENALLMGYSAGSLALGQEFRHYQSGQEVLEMFGRIVERLVPEMPLQDAAELFCPMFRPSLVVQELLERWEQFQTEPVPDDLKAFLGEYRVASYSPCLGILQGMAAYPHFGEPLQCNERHLRHLVEKHPNIQHVGIPNGMALVTTFQDDQGTVAIRGEHPHRKVTWIDPEGELHEFGEGGKLPFQLQAVRPLSA